MNVGKSELPYGYIYLVTNKVNGKSYIGSRKLSRDRYWRQYMGSGKLIKAAIQRHGSSSFTKSLLSYIHGTQEDLHEAEWRTIQGYTSQGLGGEYNLYHGPGAGGDTFSSLSPASLDEVRRRQREGLSASTAFKQYHTRTVEENRTAFILFMEKHGEEILAFYREDGSMLRTARRYSIAPKRFSQYLDAIEEPKGHGGAATNEAKRSLSRQVKEGVIYKSGETWTELHQRLLETPIAEMRKHHGREEMLALLGVSSTVYKNFLRRHGMGRKPLTCDLCLDVDKPSCS